MVEFINKLEQFINQEEDKHPFGNTDLKHFLKFLKTNRIYDIEVSVLININPHQ